MHKISKYFFCVHEKIRPHTAAISSLYKLVQEVLQVNWTSLRYLSFGLDQKSKNISLRLIIPLFTICVNSCCLRLSYKQWIVIKIDVSGVNSQFIQEPEQVQELVGAVITRIDC